MRFWFKISICQNGMVHKRRWVNFLTMVGKLEASTVCLRESTKQVQLLSGMKAAVDRGRRKAVEDFVLSQVDKPKKHRSAREISYKTTILCSSMHRIIHRDHGVPGSPAQMLQTTSCLAIIWSRSHLSSHSLIYNLIVCNKSCYCSIINRKLNNK